MSSVIRAQIDDKQTKIIYVKDIKNNSKILKKIGKNFRQIINMNAMIKYLPYIFLGYI